MRLAAKRRRKYYKSEATYIRAVYNNNKKKIAENMAPEWVEAFNGDIYKAFKSLIRDQMKYENPKTGEKYTAEEAIRRESRSKDLNKNLTTGDIYARNFHSLVTRDKEIKELFYQHEGIKKIDYSMYNFKGYYNYRGHEVAVYNYGDSYFLEYKSPKEGQGASLEYLSGYEWQRFSDSGTIVMKKYRKRT